MAYGEGLAARIETLSGWRKGLGSEEYTKEFDITSKGMKGWAMVYSQGLEEDGELEKWFETSFEFVRTSHAK